MGRLFFCFSLLFLLGCKDTPSTSAPIKDYHKLRGITMGVIPYNITYQDYQNRQLQPTIDSLLADLNMGSSTYEEQSTITQFNQSDTGIIAKNIGHAAHFIKNVLVSKEIVEKTEGYFDPTVKPLMEYYGFIKKKEATQVIIDNGKIQELLSIIGFDKISVKKEGNKFTIGKTNPSVQLDFSAIAKGYAVDEVGRLLEQRNIRNYLVEIGGEVRAKGKNTTGNWWKIGIKKPNPEASSKPFMEAISLQNTSMATSGNYENYRIIEGKKMGHTMNPKTGVPELNSLLSASVFAKDCMVADSYATALMAMGLDKALSLVQELPEIEAYFVFLNEEGEIKTHYTTGLAKFFDQ